jgi:multiple sugar transport system permease protein
VTARGLARRGSRAGLLFTLPVSLFLLTFIVFPLFTNIRLSVTTPDGAVTGSFFSAMLRDRTIWASLWVTVVYVGGSVVLQLLLGTSVGIALDQPGRLRGLVRSSILIPWVVPGIVAAMTWAWMYHGDFGIISRALVDLGISNARQGLLTSPRTVLPALIAVNVWKMFAFVAIMVLAGLQGIDITLYEAARVDGSSFWHELRYITLPGIRHVLVSILLLLTIWGFNSITIIYAMTQGGPAELSLILPLHVYRMGFSFFNFNAAAAESIFLFLILTILIAVYLRLFTSRRGEQE